MTAILHSPNTSDSAVVRRIVEVARGTFFRHGFRSVTMDDLAAQMGMSKKTLHVHFRSKQELLEAVIEGKFSSMACSRPNPNPDPTDEPPVLDFPAMDGAAGGDRTRQLP